MTFYEYDAVFRNLIGSGTSSNPDSYRAMLKERNMPFVETAELLPGTLDEVGVDYNGAFVLLKDLPLSCRIGDQSANRSTTVPPMIDLPAGSMVTPAIGTVIGSGVTYVQIRAPLCKPWTFMIDVYTPADLKADLVAYARNQRWELEQKGAPYKDLHLATDDRCKLLIQSTITGVDLMIKAGLTTTAKWSMKWSFLDGKMLISRADLDTMTLTLMAYVAKLFGICDEIEDKIQTGTIIYKDQIDRVFKDKM